MTLAHVTQTGNISLPKSWRAELGIELNSEVIMEKVDDRIVIEPLKKKTLAESFKEIDEEMKRKKIIFTSEEALHDDLYD